MLVSGLGLTVVSAWLIAVLCFGWWRVMPDWFWSPGHSHEMDLLFYGSVTGMGAVAFLMAWWVDRNPEKPS